MATLLIPSLLGAQTPPLEHAPGSGLTYRGFALAASYADFLAHARALSAPDRPPLACNTSRRTAQLMECGVNIRDPADSARFYLAAYLLEGQVAFLSFGDSGGGPLVTRMQADLESRLGRPRAARPAMWEWRGVRQRARLTWRGRGSARWIYLALWDDEVMNRIARYARRPR